MKKTALLMIIALTISVFVNAQTKVEIKSADLPKAITENIAKDYNGFAVQKAFKVTTNKVSTFEVIVLKGTDKEKLQYNAAGAFVKKSPVVASAKKAPVKKVQPKEKVQPKPAAPAAKPAAKPATETKSEPVKK
jgi:hypothetical protein